jgi:hypothetical protein
MSDHLTSRAQRLVDEFEESKATRYGIANVLTHLAGAYGDPESWYAVPAGILERLAAELREPSLLDRAMTGDAVAARQFLYEAGFTDKEGQLLPHFQSISQEDYDRG